MLTDHDLHELLDYHASAPVLSVYLNTAPADGNSEVHKLHLRSMLKDIPLVDDVSAVIRYFDHEHDWSGRSAVVFSCAPEGYLKAVSLAVPLRSRVRISDHPAVKPLADLLDSYGGYGVALVDKQGARLFYFHLGELQEQEGLMGETIRRTKRGGGSQSPGRRSGSAGQTDYVDEMTDRNFRDAAEFASHFFAERNVRRILIGGTDDNVALFRSRLPKAWQSLVVGSFPMSMTASQSEVLEKAMQIGQESEIKREAHLVNTIVTNAAKKHGGVINLDDTLSAVRDGRVQTLVFRDGYRTLGYSCTQCGYLTGVEITYCPFCGGECKVVPDVVEIAVHQVMESGGDIEVLHSYQSVGDFKEIGALLRY